MLFVLALSNLSSINIKNFMLHSWMQSSSNSEYALLQAIHSCVCVQSELKYGVLDAKNWIALICVLHTFELIFIVYSFDLNPYRSCFESVERLTSDFHKCHVLTFYKDIFFFVRRWFAGCCCFTNHNSIDFHDDIKRLRTNDIINDRILAIWVVK